MSRKKTHPYLHDLPGAHQRLVRRLESRAHLKAHTRSGLHARIVSMELFELVMRAKRDEREGTE